MTARAAATSSAARFAPARSALALATLALLGAASCGTDARGIEDCRVLEGARCEAAAPCGVDPAECRQWSRTACLSGLRIDPLAVELRDTCVLSLQAAGECARSQGPDTLGSACGVGLLAPGRVLGVCAAIREPESLAGCAAYAGVSGAAPVLPTPPAPSPDAGVRP